jgi:hypothetical protein
VSARRLRFLPLLIVAAAALAGALGAAADHGDRVEVRAEGTCSGASASELRVRAEDGWLRVEFRVDSGRPARGWSITLLRERRIAFRGTLRALGGGRSIELRRTLPAWPGSEALVVRAAGPRGETCLASATV